MIGFKRFIPAIALIAAIAMLTAAGAIVLFAEHSYREQKIDEVSVQAQILASSVTAALFFDDEVAVGEYVGSQQANPQVLVAAVYGANGSLFAGYARHEGELPPASAPPVAAAFDGDALDVAVAIVQGNTRLGTAYLRAAGEPLASRLARYGPIALLILMASLLFGVLALAQSALARANRDLVDANQKLRAQIEETEKAEEALRHSQKMEAVGQLSGGIAHDFNNLLSIIIINLSQLKKKFLDGRTDIMRHIDHAMEGANRATSVTQRILAFSRRQPLSPQAVDLNELVLSIEPLIEHSLGSSISIETDLLANWWTECDPHQMENVLLNLLINSRDAMPQGGKILIETANLKLTEALPGIESLQPGDYVKLSVIDNGNGMPDEIREKAIEPFFTTKPTGQGTGLGLSMVYGYVKQSKGTLLIDSALGRGTTMSIILPRHGTDIIARQMATTGQGAQSSLSDTRGQDRPVVFLVEDEELLREIAAEEIREAGFAVIEAGDGTAALNLMRSDLRFDILITDVRLPGASGFELAEFGISRRPNLPVIIVTGYASEPVPEGLVRSGAKVFYKPYDLDDLIAGARQLLAKSA